MKRFFNIDIIIKYSLIILLIFLPLREILSLYLGKNIKLISDAIVFSLLIITLITKKIDLKIKKQDILYLIFLVIGAISTYMNGYSIYTIIIQIRSITIYYLLYFILRNYDINEGTLKSLVKTLKIITCFLFILTIIEVIFNKMILFPEIWALSIKYADNYLRAYGLFNNPNTFAVFILMTFIFINKFNKNKNYITNIMLISIVLLTMSRSSLIFLIIYLLYYLITKNNIKQNIKNVIIPIALGIIVMLSTNYLKNIIDYKNTRQNTSDDEIQEVLDSKYEKVESSDSIADRFNEMNSDRIIESSKYNGRLYSVNKGLEIFKDYPIIGTGFGSFGSSASLITQSKIYNIYNIPNNFYADNDYIKVLVETGIIGFLIYLLFCINLFKNNKKEWILCLIFFGYGLFLNNFETQALTFMFFLMLSISNINEKYIEKGKITIYALHLNYGGVEKNICTKANILCKLYDVEIISLYKLTENPVFKLNKNVKVKYLTENIKPNRKEFNNAIKEKNIFKILKEGLYALKVLYLKNTLITKSMINCNSEIIISTRIDFTKKLINNNEYKNIKIAEEHIYHNNDKKYLKDLSNILKRIDYLMPSSNYLTKYYKELNTKYSYKIITNNMPIESDNSISNLKNKNIISVGRLDKVKGYNDLINIFNSIDNKEWTLNIVGNGPEYDNLNNQIKKLGLKDNIKLLGFKNTDELNRLYKESSIYVMTSLEESFGLVLLEAASHGLPIISYSSALGAKEILKNDNGLLIDNRNEIEMINNLKDLMSNIKLRKEYQKKSLKISEEYSYNNIEKENIDFYKNIKNTNIYNNLYTETKKECYKLVETKLKNKEKTFIVTANPETYMLSEKDLDMNNIIYNKEHLIVPDGIAIVKTANYLGYKINERITGVDLAEYLLELADKNKYKVYLFGASAEVMEKLESVIQEKYPNIKLVGSTNGYVKDKDAVMEYIKTTKPDIVMLALGIPLQEKLINKHINDFKKGIFIGVGGSFDVLSGFKKRAPEFFIKLNLEWFYRIVCEPKRISRFLKHNIRFLIKIVKEKSNK